MIRSIFYRASLLLCLTLFVFSSALQAQEALLSKEQLAKQPTFTSLAEALKQPRKVYKLKLSGIEVLPEDISKLKRLQVLDVSSNTLFSLPQSLTELKQLEELNLQHNQLSSLPDGMEKLSWNCNSLLEDFSGS